ncbi:hypothetical protein D3C84_1053870 [compost metagenome]
MGLDLVVGVGLIEGFIAHVEDLFLGLFHQRCGVRHFNIVFLGDGRQFVVGLAMIGNHHVGERLDVRRLAFFEGQSAGFDFSNTAGSGMVDEVI